MRSSIADAAVADGARPTWLLTLSLPDGSVIRVASEAVSVPVRALGGDGPYQYDPLLVGLDEFTEELDLFSLDGVGALTQAQVDVATQRDLALGQDQWLHATAATVEIALLWAGQAWEDRLVLLDGGTVQGIEWGVPGEVTTISVETTPPATSAAIGDDTRDVGVDFPAPLLDNGGVNEMTDLAGCRYQHVYGVAESVPGYKIGNVGGNNRVILAGYDFARTGGSYQVTAYVDGASVGVFTVANTTVNSQPYAYIESAGLFLATDGAVTYKATYGGIAAANDGTAAALNADGILRRLLVDSGLSVDWVRMAPTLALLRGWRVGLYVDQETTAIEAIRNRLLPYLPLVEIPGGDGLWYAYADPLVAPVEAELIVGQHLLGRVGRMSLSDMEAIRNSFTISYGWEGFSSEYQSSAELNADNDALCYLSQQLYGVREDEAIECDVTWDAATALRMLRARASRLALPRRVITYEVAADLYWLTAGAVVTLTDAGYGIAGERAIVASVNRSLVPFQVRLEIVDRTAVSRP